MKLSLLASFFLLISAAYSHAATVQVNFLIKDFPLQVKLYEPKDFVAKRVSETKLVSSFQDVPVKDEIKNGRFTVKPGQSKSLVMVLENKTGRDLYFFVAPHTMHPEHASMGFYFECLCNHSIYHLPSGKTWYRVLRLNLGKDSTQKSFAVDHQVIGLSEAEVKQKYSSRIFNAN